jgi:hypothetical protein
MFQCLAKQDNKAQIIGKPFVELPFDFGKPRVQVMPDGTIKPGRDLYHDFVRPALSERNIMRLRFCPECQRLFVAMHSDQKVCERKACKTTTGRADSEINILAITPQMLGPPARRQPRPNRFGRGVGGAEHRRSGIVSSKSGRRGAS